MTNQAEQIMWQANVNTALPSHKAASWQEIMARLSLPMSELPAEEPFYGSAAFYESPIGMEFTVLEAAPHQISGTFLEQSDAVWLFVITEGSALLNIDGETARLGPGDIAYGPCRMDATLRFPENFKAMYVRIPLLLLSQRVLSPSSMKVGALFSKTGLANCFSRLLVAVSETLDDIPSDELRPLELTLTELLISCLGGEKAAFGIAGAAGAKASRINSIYQTIEILLSDPDLNIKVIAAEHGISIRYLQKLFKETGVSFSNYVRNRRLERSKNDLVNPIYRSLSISEICFRWGFNGEAHFSRVFRKKYDSSPRDFRRNAAPRADNQPHRLKALVDELNK